MISFRTFKKRELIVLFMIISFSMQISKNSLNPTNNNQTLKQASNLSSFSNIYIDEDFYQSNLVLSPVTNKMEYKRWSVE